MEVNDFGQAVESRSAHGPLLDLLGYGESVVDLNAEISDSALDFGMSQLLDILKPPLSSTPQGLDRAKFARCRLPQFTNSVESPALQRALKLIL